MRILQPSRFLRRIRQCPLYRMAHREVDRGGSLFRSRGAIRRNALTNSFLRHAEREQTTRQIAVSPQNAEQEMFCIDFAGAKMAGFVAGKEKSICAHPL